MRKSIAIARSSFVFGSLAVLSLLLFPLLVPQPAAAQDVGRGRLLYETHCGSCHDARIHDRLRSEIRDLSDLRDAVARWAPHSKRTYSLEELEELAAYVNEAHYRIGLPPREPGRRREGR